MNSEEYLLFIGDYYYPNRWDDFRGCFSSYELAREAVAKYISQAIDSGESIQYSWYQIVSTKTWEVVYSGDLKNFGLVV